MKKLLLFVSIVGMLMVGCSSKEVKTTENTKVVKTGKFSGPDWVIGKTGDHFAAVGRFKVGKADEQYAINQATMQARAELGRMMESTVNSLMKDSAELIRGNEDVFAKTSKDTLQQFSTTTLKGSKVIDVYYNESPDSDTLYVLVGVNEKIVKQNLQNYLLHYLLHYL